MIQYSENNGIFDSHAHYDDERFDEDRFSLLDALFASGICGILNVGCDLESSLQALSLSERYPKIYAAAGYHPHNVEDFSEEDFVKLTDLFSRPKVVAVGEIGLDYHYGLSQKELQKRVFARQMEYASEHHLPVIIHSREASADTLEIVKRFPKVTGVVHCFSGSKETALEYLKLGYYIGFTGAVTFQNAKRPLEACAVVPLDRLLLETDCPYMAPVPHRGKRCESSMIQKTAEKIAGIKGLPVRKVIDAARQNTLFLFGIRD